jgi:hypothetical protein
MNLSQLIAAVYVETNRPDLIQETLQSVLTATVSLHTCEQFPGDIQAAQFVFDTPAYLLEIDVESLPLFRSLSYARKNDPTLAQFQQNPTILPPLFNAATGAYNIRQSMRMLKVVSPVDIFDEFGTEKQDVCYQAGQVIAVKSSSLLQYLLLGFYQYPNLDVNNAGAAYSSWIANEFPYAIVYEAAGQLLASVGNDTQASRYLQAAPPNNPDGGGLAVQLKRKLITNKLLLEGY